MSAFQLDLHAGRDVVVYDQNWCEPAQLSPESFVSVVLLKLERSFGSVHLLSGGSRSPALVLVLLLNFRPLSGGFLEFSRLFPGLCEGKSFLVPSCISQPCLPVGGAGPTRILPHMYLGCQRDVLNQVAPPPGAPLRPVLRF